ncbi:MAG: glycosyltransferase family 2 protein, partial [Kordiimonadaceae bacterium]|nr:glycosyltransferase family 2 protein [Kordiimonadaceae bacterium]
MEISQGVSVVIPTYNRRDDVLRCVHSVLKSDDVNFEVIVVDNASTDDTYEKLMELCDTFPCLKVVLADKNLGAGGGRNLGASHASGKYLLFLDSDNVIDSHMIRILTDSIMNSGAGMVGPLMLFGERPDRIWTYFADINPWTSRAHYLGHKEFYPQSLPRFVDSG